VLDLANLVKKTVARPPVSNQLNKRVSSVRIDTGSDLLQHRDKCSIRSIALKNHFRIKKHLKRFVFEENVKNGVRRLSLDKAGSCVNSIRDNYSEQGKQSTAVSN